MQDFASIQLLKKLKNKDAKAQKQLYDRYAPLMLGICMRYARDRAGAEDILQDGFLKIFTCIDQFSGSGSFEGWMKRIVINTAITHYHQNLKHQYHESVEDISDTVEDESSGSSSFTREELLKTINELPDGYRIVFNLYAIEGYKHKEIAEILNIDINTSKSQFSRAKKQIQMKLEKLGKN